MSTIQKRILVADRLRRPPATGWSWVDRRFLREHGDHLSREAMLLYFFLAAVADRHGLSFYSDHTLTSRLQLSPQVLENRRASWKGACATSSKMPSLAAAMN
jgi:hypothetical protein